jgi:hypothetical protein
MAAADLSDDRCAILSVDQQGIHAQPPPSIVDYH